MSPVARLGLSARRGFQRITPDPFVLAIGLTIAVLAAAASVSGGSLREALGAWGSAGLWKLLAFGMQASLMLMLGTALAEAPAVKNGIQGLARRAKSARQLVALTALVAISLSLLNWSLSLIGGALLAREAGRVAAARGFRLHYPLLCAAGYTGLMVWHGGLSGTAPLKVTNPRDLEEVLGPELAARVGPIPLERTLFSDLNLAVTGGLVLLGPLLFWLLTPAEDPAPAAIPEAVRAVDPASQPDTPPTGWLDRVERSSLVTWALCLPLFGALVLHIGEHGLGRLDLDTVNLS
jgi:short-chain fatty acids transporter